MTSSFPASQTSCRVSFPLCCSYAEAARILLTLIPPICAWKGKTYRGCDENSDLENTDLRPQKTQTPRCLENSDPQYFSTITTNRSPRAASLSFPSTEANGFAEIPPEQKFALANNFDKTKFVI